MRSRATSIHSPWACAANNFSHSIGVCETTFSNCLCDHTSFSCGATLRSPTRICRSSPCGCNGSHPLISSGNLSFCLKLGVEFRSEQGVRNIATGRDIEIMQQQRLRQLRLGAELNRDVA